MYYSMIINTSIYGVQRTQTYSLFSHSVNLLAKIRQQFYNIIINIYEYS